MLFGDITLNIPAEVLEEKGIKLVEKQKGDKFNITIHPIKYAEMLNYLRKSRLI